MSRKKFTHLLEKYQRGECTSREKKFIEYWFGMLETEQEDDLSDIDWPELEEKIWNQMHTKMEPASEGRSVPFRPFRNFALVLSGLAASVALVVWFASGSGFEMRTWFLNRQDVATGWIEKSNSTSIPQRIVLEDGSIVQLSPQSSVRYPSHFDSTKRTVFLSGRAFFDIKKNPEKPFFVYSGTMATRVLGTSFYVEERKGENVSKVEVVTGTVAVYENRKQGNRAAEPVVLKPNQQASFYPAQHKFVKGLVDKPRLSGENDSAILFRFYNTPLSLVLDNLRRAYGIDFILENKNMTDCPLTANLSGQPLYTQLDIICAALNASYTLKGTSIVLDGESCKKTYGPASKTGPDEDSAAH